MSRPQKARMEVEARCAGGAVRVRGWLVFRCVVAKRERGGIFFVNNVCLEIVRLICYRWAFTI